MSIAEILRLCAASYVVMIIVDLVRSRRYKRFAVEVAVLLGLLIVDVLITNATVGHVAFGAGTSPITVVAVMFVATVIGTLARFLFYLRGAFSWLTLLKPICISPIVLLPLISSVQAVKDLEAMQVVSFALLAFQNGFFWQTVMERAGPQK